MSFSNSLNPNTNNSSSDTWKELTSMAQDRKQMEIKVSMVNQGGCVANYKGLSAFIPNSHLCARPESPSKLIGQTLKVIPYQVDPDNRRLVLSEREARRDEHFASLEVGSSISGKLTKGEHYGLFFDLGHGVYGLLHRSSMPADLGLEVGESVDVLIASKEGGRIALALDEQPAAKLEQVLADSCIIIGKLFLSKKLLDFSVMLSDLEFALLHCLWQHRGDTVSYEIILQEWGNSDGTIEAIRNIVHQLRSHGLEIKTDHGIGYRLEVPEG